MKIAIIAALPGELKPLVKGWRAIPFAAKHVKKWTLQQGNDTWLATCAGMGAEAVRRAYAAAAADGPLDMLLSIGWAGALHPAQLPGTAHAVASIIDAQTGERFGPAASPQNRHLVTTAQVADAIEKNRLRATYPGAALVDMEAATIARLAAAHGIPFLAIKGISDAANVTLPDLNPFIDAQGQMRMPHFLAHVALRPKYWPSLIHLGKNSAHAAEAMRDLMQEFMKEKNVEKLIRTGKL